MVWSLMWPIRRWWIFGAFGILALWPLLGEAVDVRQTPVSPIEQILYLEVLINHRHTGKMGRFVLDKHAHVHATASELHTLGIIAPSQKATDAIDLADIEGLHYRYDASRQQIDLAVSDTLRQPSLFDMRGLAPPPAATSASGVVFNYDAYTSIQPHMQTAIWSELRYFSPTGVFSQDGIFVHDQQSNRYTRYETSFTRSFQSDLSTLQLGDTISSSAAWSRSFRMAGIQWRRNFALRPDLVTFPIPSLRGSTVVPSSVDLYINDIRRFSSQVPAGPFVLNQIPGILGGGMATVVTRDALGRTIATTVPLYVDTRLLAKGLSSFGLEAGFLRRDYGRTAFDYDRRPTLSQTSAYGLSSTITLNSHTEVTPGLFNAGAGALLQAGGSGVLDAALAASTGHFSGQRILLGYQLIQPHFSFDAEVQRTAGHYGDLASGTDDPVPKAEDRATMALPLIRRQTLALSYIGLKIPHSLSAHIISLSYMLSMENTGSFNASIFRNLSQRQSTGLFLGVSFSLGDYHRHDHNMMVNATTGTQNGAHSDNVTVSHTADYAGGYGWGVQSGHSANLVYQQAQAEVIGRSGDATVIARRIGSYVDSAVDANGALVFMNGNLFSARRIDDSFAVVSTNGVADVPILHENRVLGSTDRHGYLLVPDLNSYQTNQVSMDSTKLPADMRVSHTALDLTPESHSGVLGEFGVSRYQAATLTLQDATGKPLPVGSRVVNCENGQETVVGYDGETFLEDLHTHNHVSVTLEQSLENSLEHSISPSLNQSTCHFYFDYQPSTDGSLPSIGPLRCQPKPPDVHR